MNRTRRSGGFTIIEILAVVVIIATLAGLALQQGFAAVQDTRALACEKNRALLEDYEQKFHNDKNRASNALSELVSGGYVNKASCPSGGVLAWTVTDPALAWSHQALVCSVHGEHVRLRKWTVQPGSEEPSEEEEEDEDEPDESPPVGSGGGSTGTGGGTTSPPGGKTLLVDGFDGKVATGWTQAKGKSWNIADGRYSVGSAKTPGKGEHTAFTGSESWTDYDVSVNARLDAGKTYGIGFRMTSTASPNGYILQYSENAKGVGTFAIYTMTKGKLGKAIATAAAPAGFSAAAGADIRIQVRGSTFTAFVNGASVVSATDKTYGAGAVGLRTTGTTSASFDNVRVTP